MLDLLKKPVAEVETLSLNRIRRDGGTQMRSGINPATVQEYADVLMAGGALPAPVVFYDGKDHWLADGFHRCEAYQVVYGAFHRLEAQVRAGTRRDAVLYAAGANADHGLRRTQADKERAVDTLLRDEEWAAWADREIARRCNVSPTFVGVRRKLLKNEPNAERTYQTKHGTVAVMKTANIGKVEKKQLSLNQCEALIWRTMTRNRVSLVPTDRLQWLKQARMQEFWDRLDVDEAQPNDELFLQAIFHVEQELIRQAGLSAKMSERTSAKVQEIYDRGQEAKEQRGGMTKSEYAVKLMPEIAEWLRGYHDEHGRGWREIADVASHSNSICWRDITRAWGERGIYYSEDVLKAAIELAILSLQQDDAGVTVHVDSDEDTPLVACPRCGQYQADFDGFGVVHCEKCGYCTHPSATGGVCGICGITIAPAGEPTENEDRCAQLRRLMELYQGTLDSIASYGKLTGHFSHEPPLRRALEPMLAEVQSTFKALCSTEE